MCPILKKIIRPFIVTYVTKSFRKKEISNIIWNVNFIFRLMSLNIQMSPGFTSMLTQLMMIMKEQCSMWRNPVMNMRLMDLTRQVCQNQFHQQYHSLLDGCSNGYCYFYTFRDQSLNLWISISCLQEKVPKIFWIKSSLTVKLFTKHKISFDLKE